MAINVSVTDKSSDYLYEGISSLGAGIAAGMRKRGDDRIAGLRYLSESEDPAAQQTGLQGMRQVAGVTPDAENRFLSDSILAMVDEGLVSAEEADKAIQGNVAKKRELVSTGSTNRFLQTQKAIKDQEFAYFSAEQDRRSRDAAAARVEDNKASLERFRIEQREQTIESLKRTEAAEKAQVRAARKSGDIKMAERAAERASWHRVLIDQHDAGVLSHEEAAALSEADPQEGAKSLFDLLQQRELEAKRKAAGPPVFYKDKGTGAVYGKDPVTGEIIPSSRFDLPTQRPGGSEAERRLSDLGLEEKPKSPVWNGIFGRP